MIFFQLDHILHMQYDQMIQALLDGWTMGEVYAVRKNQIIFPLENGQVRAYSFSGNCFLNPKTNEEFHRKVKQVLHLTEQEPDRFMLQVESDEEELCRFLLLLIRRVYELKPFADRHMTGVLLAKLNKRLAKRKIKVTLDYEECIMPTFFFRDEVVSLEKVFAVLKEQIVMDTRETSGEVYAEEMKEVSQEDKPVAVPENPEKERPVAVQEDSEEETPVELQEDSEEKAPVDIQESFGEEKSEETQDNTVEEKSEEMQEVSPEESLKNCIPKNVRELFEHTLGGAKPGSEVYHAVSFTMGEIMYFRDMLDCAGYFYQLCDIDRIENEEDFYERLGHCYLDDRMGQFSASLKLLYKAELNEDFREKNKEKLEKCRFSQKELAEYRARCIRVGRGKYERPYA